MEIEIWPEALEQLLGIQQEQGLLENMFEEEESSGEYELCHKNFENIRAKNE